MSARANRGIYGELDAMIISRIDRKWAIKSSIFLKCEPSSTEISRLAAQTNRDPARVLDGRMSELRQAGLIKFTREGWLLA